MTRLAQCTELACKVPFLFKSNTTNRKIKVKVNDKFWVTSSSTFSLDNKILISIARFKQNYHHDYVFTEEQIINLFEIIEKKD